MNFEKFLHLLVKKNLYFARPDQFEDRNEGMPGRKAMITRAVTSFSEEQVLNSLREDRETLKGFGVSCWYCSPHESLALWNLYANGKLGIAIKTTVGKLRDSLSSVEEECYMGKVDYSPKTYDNEFKQVTLDRLFTKDPVYRSESELRVVLKLDKNKPVELRQIVQVDLHTLVDQIVVSPYSSINTEEVIRDLAEKYGLPKHIVRKSEATLSREEDLNRIQIPYPSNDSPAFIERINNLRENL